MRGPINGEVAWKYAAQDRAANGYRMLETFKK
jgi:hypothetical protein